MNFMITLSDSDFSKIEEEFQVIKFDRCNQGLIICDHTDIDWIKKLDNFVEIFPEFPSAISDFKNVDINNPMINFSFKPE